MKIIVKEIVELPGAASVTREPCCEDMEYAIAHCFIDAEWEEHPDGIRLWVNPGMQDSYEWLVEEFGKPDENEMSISYCPFCGEKIKWVVSRTGRQRIVDLMSKGRAFLARSCRSSRPSRSRGRAE